MNYAPECTVNSYRKIYNVKDIFTKKPFKICFPMFDPQIKDKDCYTLNWVTFLIDKTSQKKWRI